MFVELALILPYVFTHIDQFKNFSMADLNNLTIGQMAYIAFIVAGFTEEFSKFLVVRTTIYKSPYFDEPIDGLVYSSAAALGFASLENIEYLIQLWLADGPGKGANYNNGACGIFSDVGLSPGYEKLKRKNSTIFLWLGLLGAMAGHGLFDFLAFQQNDSSRISLFFIGLIALFGGSIALFIFLMRRAQKRLHSKIRMPICLSHARIARIACPTIPFLSCLRHQTRGKQKYLSFFLWKVR